MKPNHTLLLLLALALSACAAQPVPAPAVATSAPAVATNAPAVIPQATEKVVTLVTVTASPDRSPQKTASAKKTVPAVEKVYESPVGSLVFRTARIVTEANFSRPEPGSKILLVYLERADGMPIDLMQFSGAGMEFLIRGDDGSQTGSSMGGFVDGRFAIGFQVPETTETFLLVWPDSTVTDITPNIEAQ